MLANKLKYALEANETADERRRRENAQIEAADNELTNEMFDGGTSKATSSNGGVVSSVAGATLKKKTGSRQFCDHRRKQIVRLNAVQYIGIL